MDNKKLGTFDSQDELVDCMKNMGFHENSIEYFKNLADFIEDVLYGPKHNKKESLNRINKLDGALSYAYYFGLITLDIFHEWEKKIKDYKGMLK